MTKAVARALLAALTLAGSPVLAQEAPFTEDPASAGSSFAMRDKAGNEQRHMIQPAPQPGRVAGERCMPGTRLCFSVNGRSEYGKPMLRVRKVGEAGAAGPFTLAALPLDLEADADAELSIWSLGTRRTVTDELDSLGEAVIVGVNVLTREAYSGGAAHQIVLWLYRIDNAGSDMATARQILSVPFSANKSIRACFNERDVRMRHGACLDETDVSALLVLDDSNADAMPRFNYRVFTGTYPSDMPLREPENLPARLTQRDLVQAPYAACSYDRKLAWNPATWRVEFDRPAPDCLIYGLTR